MMDAAGGDIAHHHAPTCSERLARLSNQCIWPTSCTTPRWRSRTSRGRWSRIRAHPRTLALLLSCFCSSGDIRQVSSVDELRWARIHHHVQINECVALVILSLCVCAGLTTSAKSPCIPDLPQPLRPIFFAYCEKKLSILSQQHAFTCSGCCCIARS